MISISVVAALLLSLLLLLVVVEQLSSSFLAVQFQHPLSNFVNFLFRDLVRDVVGDHVRRRPTRPIIDESGTFGVDFVANTSKRQRTQCAVIANSLVTALLLLLLLLFVVVEQSATLSASSTSSRKSRSRRGW